MTFLLCLRARTGVWSDAGEHEGRGPKIGCLESNVAAYHELNDRLLAAGAQINSALIEGMRDTNIHTLPPPLDHAVRTLRTIAPEASSAAGTTQAVETQHSQARDDIVRVFGGIREMALGLERQALVIHGAMQGKPLSVGSSGVGPLWTPELEKAEQSQADAAGRAFAALAPLQSKAHRPRVRLKGWTRLFLPG